MNIYFVSYCAEAPDSLPRSVIADHCARTRTRTGETIEFRVDRPAGSSSEFASIVVLSVPAGWISDVQDFGDVNRVAPIP